jgi:hypothetical protein
MKSKKVQAIQLPILAISVERRGKNERQLPFGLALGLVSLTILPTRAAEKFASKLTPNQYAELQRSND